MDAASSLHAMVDAHAAARPDAVALLEHPGGATLTWRHVRGASRRLAWHLRESHGVARGDRVAIVLGQRAEAAIAHVAASRLGAITVPLSPLFGPDGLAARLGNADVALILTDAAKAATVKEARVERPVRLVDDAGFRALLRKGPALDADGPVGPDDPLFLVYTSGTTGGPKGALLPQRVIPGRMPGFLLAHAPFDERAVFWSPADWSWIGGLMDSLFAPWHAGAAVVMHERRGAFEAQEARSLMAQHGVTNAFLPPTALKAMMRAPATPALPALRAVHSAGEPLPAPVAAWARGALAPVVTQVYGLTEAAFLVGTTADEDAPDGSMGRPYPGHMVALRDGEICVGHGDPTMMLGYWRGAQESPDLPLEDGWLRTGDLAKEMEGGWLRFLGRADDIIKTSGYRVGPAEVEASLLHHPAVAECAVVGVPDVQRGQIIKAFVKPVPGRVPDDALAEELRAFVKARLAAHAYPRAIEFVEELPTTVSGKIRRSALRRP